MKQSFVTFNLSHESLENLIFYWIIMKKIENKEKAEQHMIWKVVCVNVVVEIVWVQCYCFDQCKNIWNSSFYQEIFSTQLKSWRTGLFMNWHSDWNQLKSCFHSLNVKFVDNFRSFNSNSCSKYENVYAKTLFIHF